ncbi:MAG: hypothetical protein RL180_143 [Pseudomonadota bacterium]
MVHIPRINAATAAQAMRAGGVVAYPTEAVWGLGCDPYQPDALGQILQLKQRPVEKGVILIAATLAQVAPLLAGLTPAQRAMVEASWPAAVTWLVPLTDAVPAWISGQHDRVAVRVSAHPWVQALCLAFGGPIVSTSANPAGHREARTAQEVQHYFASAVPCLDGEVGGAGQPSQIRDAMTGAVLRG